MASPIAPWLIPVGDFKRAVRLPVFHAARISDIATARHAIRDGLLDMVAMTRATSLTRTSCARSKPAWRTGSGPVSVPRIAKRSIVRIACTIPRRDGRRRCRMQSSAPINRAAESWWWAAVRPASKPLAYARNVGTTSCCSRRRTGSADKFCSAHARAGARICSASSTGGKAELERLGVEVRLNAYAHAADVQAEAPDVVIVATGGVPDIEWIEGAAHCTSVWDVISGASVLRIGVDRL
jgi:hypothetical protein